MNNYERDGYYIARGLLGHVDYINSQIREIVENQVGSRSIDLMAGLQHLLNKDVNLYLSTLRAAGMLRSVYCLLVCSEIKDICYDLGVRLPILQTGPVFHVVSEQLKIPNGYFGIGPHQDYTSTGASTNGVVVWIPLCDVDKDFYPLEVIPGSHKYGLLPSTQKGNYAETNYIKDKDFLPLEVSKGDVVFMPVFTIHRTGLQGRKGVRTSVSIRYEDASEPKFVERGYPCKYKREYIK